jgi:hypothetical protein
MANRRPPPAHPIYIYIDKIKIKKKEEKTLTPQRIKPLIQPGIPLLLHDLPPTLPQRTRIRRQRSLHPDLNRLKRAQKDIRQKLGASARAQIHDRLVHVGKQVVAVQVLEDLVEAILPRALEGVADEGRGPAEEDAAEPFLAEDGGPGLEVGFVEIGIDLAAGFDEVEGCDRGVCWAAGWWWGKSCVLAFACGFCVDMARAGGYGCNLPIIPPNVQAAKYLGVYSSILPAGCFCARAAMSRALWCG